MVCSLLDSTFNIVVLLKLPSLIYTRISSLRNVPGSILLIPYDSGINTGTFRDSWNFAKPVETF
jgi:hypothetical protein